MNELLAIVGYPIAILLAIGLIYARRPKTPEVTEQPVIERPVSHAGNPLIAKRYERLREAFRSGDRSEVLRRQSGLLKAGYEPAETLEQCEALLASGDFMEVVK